jgi:glycosyltransferase 2 family protein
VALLAGLAVSIVLTYLAFRDVDFDAFVDALREGDPVWYVASLVVLAAAYAVRVLRWWVLFAPNARPRLGPLLRALFVGDFLTSLMPVLRVGELARVVILHRETQTSRAVAFGTVVTERLQDLLTLLVLLIVAVPFAPPVSWLRGAAVLLAVLVLGLVVMLVVLGRFGSRPLQFALRPLRRLPGFSEMRTELAAEGLVSGLAGLRNVRLALVSFALTVLYWLGFALSFAFALRGVGIEFALDAGILVTVATAFSLLLPSLPASVGIFEAATLVALRPYGVADAQALSGAVVIHVLSFVPFLLIGPLAIRGHAGAVRREQRRAAESGSLGNA